MSLPSEEFDTYLDQVLVGGREAVQISIADYDPSWSPRFESERQRLALALGEAATAIVHIGSTAVPGLAADPERRRFVRHAQPRSRPLDR